MSRIIGPGYSHYRKWITKGALATLHRSDIFVSRLVSVLWGTLINGTLNSNWIFFVNSVIFISDQPVSSCFFYMQWIILNFPRYIQQQTAKKSWNYYEQKPILLPGLRSRPGSTTWKVVTIIVTRTLGVGRMNFFGGFGLNDFGKIVSIIERRVTASEASPLLFYSPLKHEFWIYIKKYKMNIERIP